MNIFWFVIGLIAAIGIFTLWYAKRSEMTPLFWILVVLWGLLLIFSIAIVTTFAGEIYPGAVRAATVSTLIFGILTIVTGVLLFRRISELK